MKDTNTRISSIGIDLGDTDAYYAMLNEAGVFAEEGRVAMTPAGIRKTFATPPPTRIALEAGAQSRWIAKLLGEYGHDVIVANPRQVQLISANQSKNDVNDARLAGHPRTGPTGEGPRGIDAQPARHGEGLRRALAPCHK
jgi:hypothetical protein